MESWRHYERAIDAYLRGRGVAYVAIEQARMLLCPPTTGVRAGRLHASASVPIDSRASTPCMPEGAGLGGSRTDASMLDARATQRSLKYFDFVVYAQPTNLLVEVKGRRVASFSCKMPRDGRGGDHDRAPSPAARLECWVTQGDIDSLTHWQRLFGPGFDAAFVFVYWCEDEPPGVLFQEVFEFERRWYALRSIRLSTYMQAMKVRSPRWGTVDLTQADFERLSEPFTVGQACAGDQDTHPQPSHAGRATSGMGVARSAMDAAAPGVVVTLESRTTSRSLLCLAKPAADLPDPNELVRSAWREA